MTCPRRKADRAALLSSSQYSHIIIDVALSYGFCSHTQSFGRSFALARSRRGCRGRVDRRRSARGGGIGAVVGIAQSGDVARSRLRAGPQGRHQRLFFGPRRTCRSRRANYSSRSKRSLAEIPEVKKDRARLEECRRRRLRRSHNYFESVAGDWERIRKSYFDDRVTSLAIEKLLPRNLTLADIGCGTGSLTFELARFARKVIGVDLSSEMLRRARAIAKEREDWPTSNFARATRSSCR